MAKRQQDLFGYSDKEASAEGAFIEEPLIKEPSMDQLKRLYGFMKEIKALEPWKRLWDMDLVCIEFPGNEEPVFCSVMGRNEECFGITMYAGLESASGLFRMAYSQEENPMAVLGYTNCITCYFGDRDDLEPVERKRIKELGLNFRGRNNWPYFRRTYPECLPWRISEADGDVLEKILEQFIAAYTCFIEKKIAVDFEKPEVIYHVYSKKKKAWITEARPMPHVPMYEDTYIIDNEVLIGSLNMKAFNDSEVELDILYFPVPAGLNEKGVPAVMRIIIMIDSSSKYILAQYILAPDDDSADAIIQVLADVIGKYGRPALLRVRDEWMEGLLSDFSAKTKITLSREIGVPSIAAIAEQINSELMSD